MSGSSAVKASPSGDLTAEDGGSTDHLKHQGEVKTPLYCHDCRKNFVALLDYSLSGNHIIECAYCGHEHCRVIENGMVTDDRWSSRHGNDKTRDAHRPRLVWKSDSLPAATSMAHDFIRNRWLEKGLR